MPKYSIRNTEVDLNFGTLIHILFGFLAAIFHKEWLFTAIFLFKQTVDLYGGEKSFEACGDIVEYCIGLVTGLFLTLLFF